MTLKTQLTLTASLLIILVALSITAQRITNTRHTQQLHYSQTHHLSYLIADEFRQTSTDLTRLCRTYVATADQTYWNAYWDIVKWRNGDKPRPANVSSHLYPGVRIKQLDIMQRLGFSQHELNLMEKVSKHSNALVAIQEQAMRSIRERQTVSGPYQPLADESAEAFAKRIAFDRNYHRAIDQAEKPIEQLFNSLSQRTRAQQQHIQQGSEHWFSIALACQTFAVVPLIGLLLLMHRAMPRPRPSKQTKNNQLSTVR